ncbi:MAG TPA: LLM class flavin-dependent oxidoreductase [Cellulomonas sp.]
MTASGAPVRFGLAVSNEVPVAETVRLARTAERLGLSEVWIPESSHGRAVFTVAAAVAAATERIGLGIGIVNPFWRHPSVIAMEAATLDELSAGRVRLGLGAALWTLRSLGEADDRARRPLRAMAEAFGVLDGLLHGGPGVDGEVYPVRADARLDFAPVRPDLPIYSGAVNQRMLRLSGSLVDGVELGAITSPGYARWAWQQVAEGARTAGRDPADLDLVSPVLVSVDTNARAARRATRRVIAYYLWRVEGVVVEHAGVDPEQVGAVRDAVAAGGVAAGEALVDDHLIDAFAAAGSPDDVAARLRDYLEAGLRGVLGWHVLGPDPERGLVLFARDVVGQLA